MQHQRYVKHTVAGDESSEHLRLKDEIYRDMRRYGVGDAGRDWLIKALHPAAEVTSPGLPDQSASSVVRPDYRIQSTISPAAGVGSWDCYIYSLPGDVNAVYWATAPSPANFTQSVAPVDATFGRVILQPTEVQPYGFGVTAISSERPTSNVVTVYPTNRPQSFRHQYKSITAHLIASGLTNQGQVMAAQYPADIKESGDVISSYTPAPSGSNYVSKILNCALPTTEADLAATAPGFYMDEAQNGVYLPLRLTGPSQPFVRSTLTSLGAMEIAGTPVAYSTTTDQYHTGAICVPSVYNSGPVPPGNSWVFQTLVDPQAVFVTGNPPGAVPPMDSAFDNTNIGVIIFRGLQGGTGGGFSSSIQLKTLAGLEVVPCPDSPNREFTRPAACYEPKAIQAYYELCFALRDAYPASYNSFGDILEKIGSVAKKIWGYVEPVLKTVGQAAGQAALQAGVQALRSAPMMVMGVDPRLAAQRGREAVVYTRPMMDSTQKSVKHQQLYYARDGPAESRVGSARSASETRSIGKSRVGFKMGAYKKPEKSRPRKG